MGDVPVSSRATPETSIKGPGFSPTKVGRPFRQVAGPELGPTALRLASLPLDPELAARLERTHRTYAEARAKAKRAAARKALIRRRTPPVNVLGGHRWSNNITIVTLAEIIETEIAGDRFYSAERPTKHTKNPPANPYLDEIPADIPAFLRRRSS